MQVVIDIDDKIYETLKDNDEMLIVSGMRSGKAFALDICYATANGTPLPKGHGRLIDADKIISDGLSKGFCNWYDEIEYAPTIIEADKEK